MGKSEETAARNTTSPNRAVCHRAARLSHAMTLSSLHPPRMTMIRKGSAAKGEARHLGRSCGYGRETVPLVCLVTVDIQTSILVVPW